MGITQNLWGRTRFGAPDNEIPEDFVEVGPSTFDLANRVGFYPHQKENGEYVFPYRTTKSVLEERLTDILRGHELQVVGGHMADDTLAIDQFCRENGIIADIERIGKAMWAGFYFKPVAIKNPLQARINKIKAIEGDWEEFNKKFCPDEWLTKAIVEYSNSRLWPETILSDSSFGGDQKHLILDRQPIWNWPAPECFL